MCVSIANKCVTWPRCVSVLLQVCHSQMEAALIELVEYLHIPEQKSKIEDNRNISFLHFLYCEVQPR